MEKLSTIFFLFFAIYICEINKKQFSVKQAVVWV